MSSIFSLSLSSLVCISLVFPILKNNHEILQKSEEIYNSLKNKSNFYLDANGVIGSRYRRMNKVGALYCVTIDLETLGNNAYTIRDRDTTKQEKMTLEGLFEKLYEECLWRLICIVVLDLHIQFGTIDI